MVQCTICEDWFHLNHLLGNEKFPTNDEDFEDMICHNCMDSNQYLWHYQGYIAVKSQTETKDEEATAIVDVNTPVETTVAENNETEECLLKKLKSKSLDRVVEKTSHACCFLSGWRSALCRCCSCLEMYKVKNVEYLLNPNDTIKYYEDRGKQNEEIRASDENKLLDDHLSKMNRVSQIEFLHNVKDFKEDLTSFLASFATNGQVIKRENVVQFFDDLKEKKKRKLENGQSTPSYFCK